MDSGWPKGSLWLDKFVKHELNQVKQILLLQDLSEPLLCLYALVIARTAKCAAFPYLTSPPWSPFFKQHPLGLWFRGTPSRLTANPSVWNSGLPLLPTAQISSLIASLPHTCTHTWNSNHTGYLSFTEHLKDFCSGWSHHQERLSSSSLPSTFCSCFEPFLKHMAPIDFHLLPPAKINCCLLWALSQHWSTCTVISPSLSVINWELWKG